MSTYGLVIIADLSSEVDGERLVDQVERALNDKDPSQANNLDWRSDPGPLGVQVSIDVPGAVTDSNEEQFFTGLPAGRAVLCVDGDEYGVTFSAWRLTGTQPDLVYLSHLNDPDIDDDGTDAGVAGRIRTGGQAVTELANLYGVSDKPLLSIEKNPTAVTDNLGVIGTPFDPWLDALNLQWPQL
ncbi:hypothetical protein GOEFS_035_00480 [Gordonia effusa NBRC 100432]|uniref:Uncharacterized protein n=1 Tax=Gordonia effusa NBRC 100432 TaxID=1077974 RepID=H0QXG5_9ACTN|nr:hypothetical protein [Gordonia effusa]GAB17516.1 hypothetical protein GOEFS_035_00480 [Gordonia effusa NBRC 100432]